jgi:hypothetical protein
MIAEFVCEYVGERLKAETKKLRDEFNVELGSLRADLGVLRGVATGEIATLRAEIPAKRRKQDAA